MNITIPLVLVFGILLYVAYRYMGLRMWHALIAIILGFLLAATSAAPQIHNLLTGLVQWLQSG